MRRTGYAAHTSLIWVTAADSLDWHGEFLVKPQGSRTNVTYSLSFLCVHGTDASIGPASRESLETEIRETTVPKQAGKMGLNHTYRPRMVAITAEATVD